MALPSTENASAEMRFTIYVAGEAPHSVRALHNLQELCNRYWKSNFHIEVIDVLLNPERAWADGVMVTPTTVRHLPTPRVTLVGDLNNTARVLWALGVPRD